MPRVRTKLREFLSKENLTSEDLEAASGTNRKTMTKYKRGENLRFTTMLRILCGARHLAARKVDMSELWDLDPSADDCAGMAMVVDKGES
jgi:transcriptional regulator with XRE-family HTH domain